ncbi:MAG: DUF6049 family protein [Actinomycetota bacterium]
MTRPLVTRRIATLALGVLAAIAPCVPPFGPSPVAAEGPARLRLIAQSFNVVATGSITMTVQVPAAVLATDSDHSVSITAYRPVAGRDAVEAAVAGELNRSVDTVELDSDQLFQPVPGQLQFAVPIEVTTRTRTALQMSKPGVHPVLVEYRVGGDEVAELITFVHRVPSDKEEAEEPLTLAFVASTLQPVRLADDGTVVVDQPAVDELSRLADLLERSPVPLTVRVPPAVLDTVESKEPALARRLVAALERNDLLSAPALPIDPSSAAAAGREALYTQWLRDGEDTLAAAVERPSQRTMVFSTAPLSAGGGALLRGLGARLVVMPPVIFDGIAGADTPSRPTGLFGLDLGDGITVDGAVTDASTAAALNRTDHELAAIEVVSGFLAERAAIAEESRPSRHGFVVGEADLGVPALEPFLTIAELIAETPGLQVSTVDEFSVRTDRVTQDGEAVLVPLPGPASDEVARRAGLADEVALQSVAVASMLPDEDRRTAEWARLTSVLPTSALSDAQATAIATRIRQEQQSILGAVEVPAGFSVNLTGRRGTVRVSLRNNAAMPLDVKVRMTASKLQFPEPPPIVTLAPGAFTEVRIDVVALSNGRIPATLDLFTPEGDTRLAPPVPVSLSLTALSGVGNLVTGAALIVLLTWWVRHIRRGRRQRAERAATTLPDS